MKLVRFGSRGAERPGCIGRDGVLRDISDQVGELDGRTLDPATLARLAALPPATLPAAPPGSRLGPCVANVGKVVCVGLNYREHVVESRQVVPSEPVLFMKAPSCIAGPYDGIEIPVGATEVDWEIELAVIIGSTMRRVAQSEALRHVAGYCAFNDVSERAWQLKGTGQWVKGKSADTFGPLGPWLVTADEVPDPQRLRLWLTVNDERRQDSSTADMIFPVASLLSFISRFMTLCPGDVVATGTPSGVALGGNPPRYLRAGDVVRCGVEGLGEQRLLVSAA
jgi:2-keto-4-pentenoate hydratase/2-oxohepta-3-ene-1,7-dioic acid hydratase in catechol pathway